MDTADNSKSSHNKALRSESRRRFLRGITGAAGLCCLGPGLRAGQEQMPLEAGFSNLAPGLESQHRTTALGDFLDPGHIDLTRARPRSAFVAGPQEMHADAIEAALAARRRHEQRIAAADSDDADDAISAAASGQPEGIVVQVFNTPGETFNKAGYRQKELLAGQKISLSFHRPKEEGGGWSRFTVKTDENGEVLTSVEALGFVPDQVVLLSRNSKSHCFRTVAHDISFDDGTWRYIEFAIPQKEIPHPYAGEPGLYYWDGEEFILGIPAGLRVALPVEAVATILFGDPAGNPGVNPIQRKWLFRDEHRRPFRQQERVRREEMLIDQRFSGYVKQNYLPAGKNKQVQAMDDIARRYTASSRGIKKITHVPHEEVLKMANNSEEFQPEGTIVGVVDSSIYSPGLGRGVPSEENPNLITKNYFFMKTPGSFGGRANRIRYQDYLMAEIFTGFGFQGEPDFDASAKYPTVFDKGTLFALIGLSLPDSTDRFPTMWTQNVFAPLLRDFELGETIRMKKTKALMKTFRK